MEAIKEEPKVQHPGGEYKRSDAKFEDKLVPFTFPVIKTETGVSFIQVVLAYD
jgi:hypothetical protein